VFFPSANDFSSYAPQQLSVARSVVLPKDHCGELTTQLVPAKILLPLLGMTHEYVPAPPPARRKRTDYSYNERPLDSSITIIPALSQIFQYDFSRA
jgi:hypothetical protein